MAATTETNSFKKPLTLQQLISSSMGQLEEREILPLLQTGRLVVLCEERNLHKKAGAWKPEVVKCHYPWADNFFQAVLILSGL